MKRGASEPPGRRLPVVPVVVILVIALGARLAFSLTNVFAEDDHYQVIELLMAKGVYPDAMECWECFQPPAFYHLAALWLRLAASLGFPVAGEGGIHAVEVLNGLLGFGTLLVILFWLSRLRLSRATTVFTLALVALNPRFVAINSQVANDTLAIAFSTVGLVGLHLFYLERRSHYLYASALAMAVATLTKGSALPCLGVFTLCLLLFPPVGAALSWSRRGVLVAGVWLLAFFGGAYESNLANYGTPFVVNYGRPIDKAYPQNEYLPLIFDHDEYFSEEFAAKRPPWGAVAWESFFTFRPLSLLSEPWNDKSPEAARGEKRSPDHMRSVWTQLFARANAITFHPEPEPYGSSSAASHQLSRGLFVGALGVLLVVLIALARESRRVVRDLRGSWPARTVEHPAFVPLVTFLASAAFVVAYNLRLGHFAATKAVYYFPGLMAYLYFFAVGREWLARRKGLQRGLDALVVLLLLLGLLEVGSVIQRLHALPRPF